MEDWKPIPTFSNYDICIDGRIRNRRTGKYLKINWENGSGYVALCNKGKVYFRSVQKLLEVIHKVSKPHRTPPIKKCPNCGALIGGNDIDKHLTICHPNPRDPNIEYFEF